MADKPQNSATASAPTAGSPAAAGTSTAATPSAPAHLTPSADVSSVDFDAMLAADLAGPEMTAAQQEQQGTPPDEAPTDPLQAELDAEDTSAPEEPKAGQEAAPEGQENEPPKEPDDQPDPNDDDESVPKGMENWPAPAVKRIQKQSETIRALKAQVAQGGIQITPTEASPLADVGTIEALEQRLQNAKGVRAWCKENPDGGTIKLANGGVYEVTPEMAQAKLATAEREIEAYPDRKLWLSEREKSKPWEAAETVAPGILTAGTQENTFYTNVLKAVPELAAKLPDYEVFLACAARGMRQLIEEQQGTAKYVRMEVKDGKLVTPQRPSVAGSKASPASAGKPATTPQAQPFRPTNQRPPARAAGAPQPANFAALEARAAAGDEAAQRALLTAELAAA